MLTMLTLKTGTFPKKEANFSASIVADVTNSFRSFLRETTCDPYMHMYSIRTDK